MFLTCYRCVFQHPPPPNAVPTCQQAGVLGVMGGVIGSIQATEALKYITRVGELLTGNLLTYDTKTMLFRKIDISHGRNYSICNEGPTINKLIDYESNTCG